MNSVSTEVLIVGAGPSGSTLAALLASRGVDVSVVDRASFPRQKACGECVNPGAVKVLQRLGVLEQVLACSPAKIHEWEIKTSGGRRALGQYPPEVFGLGIPRLKFDSVLLRHALSCGARVREQTQVVTVTRDGDGYSVDLRSNDGDQIEMRCRFLVGADGLRSVIARRLGMVRRGPNPRKVSITCRVSRSSASPRAGSLRIYDDHTLGLAPVHDSSPIWNATVVFPSNGPNLRSTDPRTALREKLDLVEREIGEPLVIVDGPWTSGPFDWRVDAAARDDALLVGDAAGYFDPLTGQGVYQALRTAESAADVIEEATHSDLTDRSRLWSHYSKDVARHQRPTRLVQKIIENIVRRRTSRDFCIQRLARSPGYANRVIRFTGDDLELRALGRLDLVALGRWSR